MKASDWSLVNLLQRNARVTNRSLAEAAHMAPSTTLGRVRDLEQHGTITGYHAAVDLTALGRPLQALIFVKLRPKTDLAVTEFVEAVWGLDETLAVYLLSGADDAVVHVAVADTAALRNSALRTISTLPGVIDERTSLVFEHKAKRVVPPATMTDF
ncbi:MAG: Lrp/AsnC family transcriptional regulator [Actinobacteria bacterium]|nr:Lrp/AsnC family transcriptional regulator [Actinomycetota bacterium]